jgi:hypothetical protein
MMAIGCAMAEDTSKSNLMDFLRNPFLNDRAGGQAAAVAVLLDPLAARSTIRARGASAWAVLRRRAHPSSSVRSASLSTSVVGTR